MGKIEQVQECIEKAERLESKLVQDSPEWLIGGFTSPQIRHLLNNLGSISTSYLEIGVHRGSTFVSAMYGNLMEAVAIDNWSEFNEDNTVRDEFILNSKPFNSKSLFIESDCFKLDASNFNDFDLYLYDGSHGYEEQKLGVTHFYKSMAEEFILCVDDSDWEQVIAGTIDGLKEVNANILFERRFTGFEGYHNGFYVSLIKK